MEAGKVVISRLWTDDERERLRGLIAAGSTTAEAAELLGRPVGGVRSTAHKMRLVTWDSVTLRTRDAIRGYAGQGWASSRIARRFGVPVQAVDAWTGRSAR